MIYHNLKEQQRSLFIALLSVLACGAIALPMLPIWQGGLRLLAGLALVSSLAGIRVRRSMMVFLGILLLLPSGVWVQGAIREPFAHYIHALTDVFGQPLGLAPDGMLLLYDLICVAGLGLLLIRFTFRQDRLAAIFAGCATLFWLWTLLALVKNTLAGTDPSHLAQMMTGQSGWATWAYWALLPLLLVRKEADVQKLLSGAGFGGLLVGIVVALQWMVGDYSYVLDTLEFSDYFYRVRGTDYYHASAAFGLALGSMALLGMIGKDDRRIRWIVSGAALLILMTVLNNTRAISIALAIGLTVIFAASLHRQRYVMAIAALIGIAALSTNILYVKPVSGTTTTVVEQQETKKGVSAGEAKPVEVKDVVAANSSRSILAGSGLHMLPKVAWFGTGVGILELPLEGNAFNGMKTTYSTHILYLDILLMAGIPALSLLAAMFILSAWRSAANSVVRAEPSGSLRAPAILAALVIFAIASLFLPQERNELIGIAFLFAALSLFQPETSMEVELVQDKMASSHITRWGFGLIAFGVAGWAIATSPAYFFPVIEFVARNGREVAEEKERVAVTEPLMKPMLERLLRLRGVEAPDVFVLEDNPRHLPKDKTWILWSPARDSLYPSLRRELGYQKFRQGGHAPSLGLSPNWWVVPSSQPMVLFLYVGARPDIPLPIQEIASVTAATGAVPVLPLIAGLGTSYKMVNDRSEWAVEVKHNAPRPLWLDVHPKIVGVGVPHVVSMKTSGETGDQRPLSLAFSGGTSTGIEVDLKGRLYTWPNQAERSDIVVSDNIGKDMAADSISKDVARNFADLNYGSFASWKSDKDAIITFDLRPTDVPPIGVYRMVGLNWRSVMTVRLYTWTVDGSQNGNDWVRLDERRDVELSLDSKSPSTFFLSNREHFRYYRFHFLPNVKEQTGHSGLMEIELYPIP